ncbi:response regulator [Pseudomonas sp. LP_7_YM]|uniref:response regulator n=1 Tax=Pseudomonas sp. LP_7_YM TaxID=2485137 RepID=UPI001061F841|nr:response regulator [Pseudomonas sp. LP_7_YM]TDV72486.1 response regulator receiver domain-containing protein [Pseudomonas sp. LP_7_YM]
MTTILIVDDEYLIADILSFALEDEGYMTVTAGSGQRALSILEREQPQLIITDYMMPGMNGIEFAEAVRAHRLMHSVPLVLMSGAQAHLGMERPDLFVEVFDKPFDIYALVSRVKFLLQSEEI